MLPRSCSRAPGEAEARPRFTWSCAGMCEQVTNVHVVLYTHSYEFEGRRYEGCGKSYDYLQQRQKRSLSKIESSKFNLRPTMVTLCSGTRSSASAVACSLLSPWLPTRSIYTQGLGIQKGSQALFRLQKEKSSICQKPAALSRHVRHVTDQIRYDSHIIGRRLPESPLVSTSMLALLYSLASLQASSQVLHRWSVHKGLLARPEDGSVLLRCISAPVSVLVRFLGA